MPPKRFFQAVDKLFTRAEVKGQNAANTIHRWSINLLLGFMAYNIYSIFAGYNQTLLNIRVELADAG